MVPRPSRSRRRAAEAAVQPHPDVELRRKDVARPLKDAVARLQAAALRPKDVAARKLVPVDQADAEPPRQSQQKNLRMAFT